jgi:hypothetical protein
VSFASHAQVQDRRALRLERQGDVELLATIYTGECQGAAGMITNIQREWRSLGNGLNFQKDAAGP